MIRKKKYSLKKKENCTQIFKSRIDKPTLHDTNCGSIFSYWNSHGSWEGKQIPNRCSCKKPVTTVINLTDQGSNVCIEVSMCSSSTITFSFPMHPITEERNYRIVIKRTGITFHRAKTALPLLLRFFTSPTNPWSKVLLTRHTITFLMNCDLTSEHECC